MPDYSLNRVAVPVGATAQRPRWADLPAEVRGSVERFFGAGVISAVSQNSGFTPGFASRLWLSDGRTVFAKAVSDDHEWLTEAYQTEAAKLAVLPAAVPAPRVQGTLTVPIGDRSWFVLLLDDIDGSPPVRPWRPDQAEQAIQVAVSTAAALTPAPTGRNWMPIAGEIDPMPEWNHACRRYRVGAAARDLSLDGLSSVIGSTLVHTDLRDDNVIMGRDGRVWFCDWNFPTVGPQWVDAVTLAISMRGDGLDADALLEECGAVPADDITVDIFLATLLGYFARAGQQAVPDTSPWLRRHQTWYGDVVADWLTHRRNW